MAFFILVQSTTALFILGFKPNNKRKILKGLMINKQMALVIRNDKTNSEIILSAIDVCQVMI